MRKTLQVLNIIGLIAVILVNYLAATLPLNGRTPGQISDLFPSLFTPAGFTFGIWSVIYVLLIIFIVRQAKGLFRSGVSAPDFVEAIGPLFIANCAANVAWLFAWHYLQFGLAMALMLGILGTLIAIYLRLVALGRTQAVHWTVTLPFSVYLGWITVATIANASILLIHLGWDGFGIAQSTWAAIMIGAGTLIGLIVIFKRSDVWYAMVLIWAFYGIMSARNSEDSVAETVVTTALVGMILLFAGAVFSSLRKLRR